MTTPRNLVNGTEFFLATLIAFLHICSLSVAVQCSCEQPRGLTWRIVFSGEGSHGSSLIEVKQRVFGVDTHLILMTSLPIEGPECAVFSFD